MVVRVGVGVEVEVGVGVGVGGGVGGGVAVGGEADAGTGGFVPPQRSNVPFDPAVNRSGTLTALSAAYIPRHRHGRIEWDVARARQRSELPMDRPGTAARRLH